MAEKVYINKTAQDLFPALFEKNDHNKSSKIRVLKPAEGKKYKHLKAPRPPDRNWLRKIIEPDVSAPDTVHRRALILSIDNDHLLIYNKILKNLKFAIDIATSESAAIELISLHSFSLVIYEESLKFHDFEQSMRNLAGDKRRNLYYAIIGPKLKTLYDLEALCLSANLVVNSKDVQYLDKILEKGFKDYETLYRPFIEILHTGKD